MDMTEVRKSKILETLRAKRSVRIMDLSKQLRVSRETIRKDLAEMEQEGLLRKTYGGAVLDEANVETDYDRRRGESDAAKKAIAQRAVKFIEPGDTIYLDYGTTTYALAEQLANSTGLTVVTNTIPIVNRLIHSPGIELIILGGNVRKNEDSLFGSLGLNSASDIFVDIGFFGCAGITPQAGPTNYHMGEIEISKLMVAHSRTSILLADASKIGRSALYRTSEIADIDIFITDDIDDSAMETEFTEANVEVIKIDRSKDE
ncbi:transcriptional regulator, DeoR family [Coriobacterium glomerans PW2]|uniref:Transcriptional regulator, DeoR family n=2 Tax=Coriobacterium TaxID=33870 RepID=F2NAK4_CORGP|nr:transcriptional regulator, DeoR family [Coriobacterium glomerans PW2]